MNPQPTLLQRIAAGDARAIEECLAQYRGLIWSIARRFSANRADAEDAVQEVFIQLWRYAGRFDPEKASESTFVGTIARRRLIDRQRRQAARIAPAALVADPAATAPSDIERLDTLEEGQRAHKLLEQLRPEQRTVLEMSFDRGMTQQEIAAATQLPLGTVKTRARRGLMRLRELLEVPPPAASNEPPQAKTKETP